MYGTDRVGVRRLVNLVEALPWDSAYARSRGGPVDPGIAVLVALADAMGTPAAAAAPAARRRRTAPGERVLTFDEAHAMWGLGRGNMGA